MPTAAQDQWLGKLGVNALRAKSGPNSDAGTALQDGAKTASAPATLGKIPVPQVSGESKDTLVKAMRTIDSIQPSDRAKGSFTIVTAEGTKEISKAQADDIRAKTKAALKRNIAAVKLKAEAATARYSEQKKVNADQWAVAAAVKFAREVTSLGRFEDPGPALTKEVEAARAGIAAAAAAADANGFAKAAEAYADAEAAAARAACMAQIYVEGMIKGAGASITVLEGTRDLAFFVDAALATIATAGAASGAMAAGTTALGATAGTASVIATAAPIAGSVATAATKVALGDKVDWSAVALDASLQLFIARFGGPATKGIAAAVTKRLAGNLAAESIARIGVEKMVQAIVVQEGSATLATAAQSVYAVMRGKDITWEQVFKTLLARLTDPKGLAVAAVLAGIATRAEMKSDELFPNLTDEEVGSAIDNATSDRISQHESQDPGLEAPREPPESDKLLPELTEKEVGTAVDDATSGTPLREKVYRDEPEIDDATNDASADGAASGSPDKLLPELTDQDVGSAVDNARAGTMIEAPGQNPHTGEGLVDVEIRADETAGIAHQENMTFKGIAGVPPGDQVQVRRHSPNSRAPAGSRSRDNPTTQINTVDPAHPRQSKEFQLPDGTRKRFDDMTEAEKAAAHLE